MGRPSGFVNGKPEYLILSSISPYRVLGMPHSWCSPGPPTVPYWIPSGAGPKVNRMNRPHSNSVHSQYVSTYQVAEALGVSVTTVKRWVDDGILPADVTPGGHRKLRVADVRRLAREGDFPQSDLSRLEIAPVARRAPRSEVLRDRLIAALQVGDSATVRGVLVGGYRDAGLSIETIADEIVSPAMQAVGHGWEAGELDVYHEHRGTQLCQAALFELKSQLETHADKDRPVAIGGAPEFDHYTLPSLLAQMALLDSGWNAIDIGPNTPMKSFEKALEEFRPRLVWISVSFLADDERFVREYKRLYRIAAERGIAVAVGGQALSQTVRQQIPYTTHGDGLTQLVAFARTLHPRPKRPRRGRPPGT